MTKPLLTELQKNLGYEFKEASLLDRALTHRSASPLNNERFEFFGDSILGVVVSEYLFHQFPKASEGQLTRLRAKLVKKESLSIIAKKFSIETYVTLGQGEKHTGGAQRASIQADAIEAIIAAIYLESGIEKVKECIYEWYQDIFAGLTLKDEIKDPKTQLQEYLQGKRQDLPVYQVVECQGPQHEQNFTVSCDVSGFDKQIGKGKTRRAAEQESAQKMLEVIRGRN